MSGSHGPGSRPKQGQYLAFNDAYTRLNRRPPDEWEMQTPLRRDGAIRPPDDPRPGRAESPPSDHGRTDTSIQRCVNGPGTRASPSTSHRPRVRGSTPSRGSTINRGVFRCVVDLQAAINRFVAETNHDPKPFTWTADPDKIIAAVRGGLQVLDSIQ